MSRDVSGRHDRRDEREAVAHARDVAIGEARVLVAPVWQQARGLCRKDACTPTAIARAQAKRLDVLALDDGESASAEACAVFSGVQLAAEANMPTGRIAQRRKSTGDRVEQCQIGVAPDVRDPAGGSREAFEQRRRQAYGRFGRRVAALVGQRLNLFDARQTEPRVQLARRRARARDDRHEAHAAVDRKQPMRVVESDDGIDTSGVEQPRPQARGAIVGRQSPREHEPDAAAGACERQGTLRNG